MTVIAFDGFETYSGAGSLVGLMTPGSIWGYNTGSTSLVTGLSAGSAQAARIVNPGWFIRTIALASNLTTWGGGFRMKCDFSGLAAATIVQFYDSALAIQCHIRLKADGNLEAYQGASTLLGTSDGFKKIVAFGIHYINFELFIDDTTGTFKIWIDGKQVMDLSGVDTKGTAVAGADYIALGGVIGGYGTLYDDFYVTDGAHLGDRVMWRYYPTADTAQKDLTASAGAGYSCVDDLHVSTDYVYGSTAAQKDIYDMANLAASYTEVNAVKVAFSALKTDGVTRVVKGGIKSNATESYTDDLTLSTDNTRAEKMLLLDPNGDIAWTPAAVDALQGVLTIVS